jgi:hypothetical protein
MPGLTTFAKAMVVRRSFREGGNPGPQAMSERGCFAKQFGDLRAPALAGAFESSQTCCLGPTRAPDQTWPLLPHVAVPRRSPGPDHPFTAG